LDLFLFLNGGKIGASLAGPCPWWYYWMPDIYISEDIWTHVALTYDGSAMKMYKNGVCEASLSASGNLLLADSSSNESFYIGKNTDWSGYYDGRIDDVRIYSRAVSADEIASIWSQGSLVGYWQLDETGGTTAHDSSGNDNDGTLFNMDYWHAWCTGHVGGALDFDGYNDYVRVYDNSTFDIANKITLAAWINPDNGSSWKTIASKFAHVPYCRKDLYWFIYNNKIGACLAGPCWDNWTPDVSISTGVWTHVALIYDGSALKMYKNGVSAATTSASGNLMLAQYSSNESFYLGRNNDWGYNGRLDDIRLYGWSLSDTQIEAIYNGQQLDWPDESQILP
jgi:hypothetical protein